MTEPRPLSYMEEVWREFRRHRLAVVALTVAAVVLLVALYCPLIANNRPLYLRAPIVSEYRDATAIAAEQLQLSTPESAHIAARSLGIMREHLSPPERRELEALLVTESTPSARADALMAKFFDRETVPVMRFPAFRALSRAELAALLLLPFFLLLRIGFKRRSNFALLIVAAVMSLAVAQALRVVYPDVQDTRSYRRLIASEEFARDGFALMAPVAYGENENLIADARTAPTWLVPDAKRRSGNWHWLGTDTNGRDVLARMVYGARVSMLVGVLSVGLYTLIGMVLGSIAGFYGGWTDQAVSRLLEFVICFPVLMVILAVQAFLAPSLWNLILALALLWWTSVARLQRAEFLRLADAEFVHAVRALGGSDLRIMALHLIPNSLAPILVVISFGIAGSIVVESALSFLGFGVPQPMASWGDLLNNGRNDVSGLWWLTIFPGLAIFLTVTCFNLVGEALRDALDPRRTH
ncbi:ABC transporter permease subunit [bacterium]|nr:ABC transporter permease subunit [bacterium]